jgi:hypothetical protein
MGRSHRLSIVVVAMALLVLVAGGTGLLTGCGGSDTPVASGTPSAGAMTAALRPMADFKLVATPLESEVEFTGDRVVWRVPPQDVGPRGPWPDVEVSSFDIAGGATTTDEWLTGLLSRRAVTEWVLAGDRVAWIDISETVGGVDGYDDLFDTSVYTATRGRPAREVSSPAWSAPGDSGRFEPAAWGLACNEMLVTWFGRRSELAPETPKGVKEVEGGYLWAWDATDGGRHRLADQVDEARLAVGGRRVFTAAPPSPASSSYPKSTIHAWDAGTDTRSTIRQDDLVHSPAAADEKTLVWTVMPPMATDFVDVDLAGYDLDGGKAFTLSRAPGGQSNPAVDGDLVVWVDTPLGSNSPLPDGSWPLSTLRGIQLSRLGTNAESTLVADPFTDESEDSPFNDVTLIGDRLFWTIMRDDACTAYGARVVVGADGLTLEPLRD